MIYLVCYDISTIDRAGRRRLRRVAKYLERFGDRLQKSVFELNMPPKLFDEVRTDLLSLTNAEEDNLLFYQVPTSIRPLVETHGIRLAEEGDGRYVTIF